MIRALLLIALLSFHAHSIPVTGRVVTEGGRGISGVRIVAAAGVQCGNWQTSAVTNSFGYFRMEVIGNCEMVISPRSRRYAFCPDGVVFWPGVPTRGASLRFIAHIEEAVECP